MIIVKISGGLGNQLFQYATARSIAMELNRKLYIDNSWFYHIHKLEDSTNQNATTKRDYSLDNFNLESKVLSSFYINMVKRVKIYSKNSKIFTVFRDLFLRKLTYTYIDSKNHSFSKLKSVDQAYLVGNWQNNNIIDHYRDILLNELQLKNNLSDSNIKFLKKINGTNSVAIHFRRGDYISKPNSSKLHVTCSNKYYKDAINQLKGLITNPHYFIFSDEIEWVKANITLPINSTFIDNNGPPHEHLHLMRSCKHQITANSTFSWWAAWLNIYPQKMIITPKYWYYDSYLNKTIIRIPNGWIKIDNLN